MAFKFIILSAFVAIASAGVYPGVSLGYAEHSAPLVYASAPVAKVDAEYDPHPEYKFSYNVHDSLTGDAKTQEETRHGDVVEGSYSLVEADGSKRIVHYTADPLNGFNAVVEKQPATVAVKHVQPVVHAAPAPVHHAPVVYKSAPVYTETAYQAAAPVAHAYSAHAYPAQYYHH